MQATLGKPHQAPPESADDGAASDFNLLAVMLDVTANLLCTAIILLVLSLVVSNRTPGGQRETDAPLVTGRALPAATLLTAFHARTVVDRETVAIDVLATGYRVVAAGTAPAEAALLRAGDPATPGLLARLLEPAPRRIRLFLFSQEAYAPLREQLAARAVAVDVDEIDVPLALRSAADPQDWSPGFRRLYGQDLDAAAFQVRLQQLLVGGGQDGAGRAPDTGSGRGGRPAGWVPLGGWLDGLWRAAVFGWRFALVGAALAVLLWRRRGARLAA